MKLDKFGMEALEKENTCPKCGVPLGRKELTCNCCGYEKEIPLMVPAEKGEEKEIDFLII